MRLLVSVIAAVMLLGLTSPVDAAPPGEMRMERARTYYLATVCPHQASVDEFNHKLFHGRRTVSGEEIRRRLPELRRMSERLVISFNRIARKMENSPREWPTEIGQHVERFVDQAVDTSYYLGLMAQAVYAQGFIGHYENAVRVSRRGERIAVRVTAYLNIGKRACDRR